MPDKWKNLFLIMFYILDTMVSFEEYIKTFRVPWFQSTLWYLGKS